MPTTFDYEKPHALVTLAYAEPPERVGGKDVEDYYTRLLAAAEAQGWYWTASQLVNPARDNTPPKNGDRLVAKLDALITEAQQARETAMSYTELDTENAPYVHALERLAREVGEANYALPDPVEAE